MPETLIRLLIMFCVIVTISACRMENTIEASGGLYTDQNQSLSK